MPLRPYQQEAFDAVVNHIKTSVTSCLVDAATGAGKSHIIAAIAEYIYRNSQKRVIVLQPNKKLLLQNREKFLKTGYPASVYSASAGAKCLKYPVVFATPKSLKNSIKKVGKDIAAVILDEAHGVTPTFKSIISELKCVNPNLRVIGLTATPYRLGTGYIYQFNIDDKAMQNAVDPFFYKLVYKIDAKTLIEQGYLTHPAIGESEHGYETISIRQDQRELDKAVAGQGRKTSGIVKNVVELTQGRSGVIIFATTIQHANEIAASLPKELTGIVTGGQSKENDETLERFAQQKIKYLVNVDMLTTGYDATHIDCVVLMRATESAALLQQMIGRGLRLHDGKLDCLVLDYAENIERHAPDGDIFNPEIIVNKKTKKSSVVEVECPQCSFVNAFKYNVKDCADYEMDKHGYAIDLMGNRISTEYGDMPAHHGRRCNGIILGTTDRCGYRWTYKECEACGEPNDIAARYCASCKHELVDPNEKLRKDFIKRKKDPTAISTDIVNSWIVKKGLSKAGNMQYTVTYYTDYNNVTVYYPLHIKLPETTRFLDVTHDGRIMPKTITYYKSGAFWRILKYNEVQDEIS